MEAPFLLLFSVAFPVLSVAMTVALLKRQEYIETKETVRQLRQDVADDRWR